MIDRMMASSLLGPGKISVAPIGMGVGGRSGARPILGAMHDGGEVPKDGAYELKKGEKVTPVKDNAPARNSEYRKIYLARKGKK